LTSILNKLQNVSDFKREGDKNVFACTNQAIVDTFAKHWASCIASSVAILTIVSSQLADKQRRHQQYLNFLAISKCHEKLQHKQNK
jgi:nuclear pore complex protein Nup133